MTDNDRKEFAQLCTLMSQAFDKPMSEVLIGIYFDSLKDFDIKAVESAVKQAIASKKFMPKVAELRELIEGGADDRAELAWRTFVELVRDEAAYPSLQVYDGAMAYAIECLGGWLVACAKLNEASAEMAANYEKHFKNSYRLGAIRAEQPRYLVGQHEVNNRGLGSWKAPTINLAVVIVRPGAMVRVSVPFDIAAGAITDEARKALEAGGWHKYLKPAGKHKALPPAPRDKEIATPEEVAQLKRQIDALANR